jgi:hypothetical protein
MPSTIHLHRALRTTPPAEACHLGWQESLVLLGKLVEAEVSGG